MPGITIRKAVICFFAEIAQLPDGTYCVSLTATTVDDEEPQLLYQEIDSRRGVSLDEALTMIRRGDRSNLNIGHRDDTGLRIQQRGLTSPATGGAPLFRHSSQWGNIRTLRSPATSHGSISNHMAA